MEKIFTRILTQVEAKKNIEEVLAYLRNFDFRFIGAKDLNELYIDGFFPTYKHQKYQILIRRVKKENYDLRLAFAIKMLGKKTNKISIYRDGTYLRTIRKPWKTNIDVNFRKTIKRWKFPDGLTYQERRNWRAEHRKVINPRSKHEGSEFYFKWKPLIVFTENPE